MSIVHLRMHASIRTRSDKMFGQRLKLLRQIQDFTWFPLTSLILEVKIVAISPLRRAVPNRIRMQHPLRRRALPEPKRKLHSHDAHELGLPLSREGDEYVAQKPFSHSRIIHSSHSCCWVPCRRAFLYDYVQGRG